MLCMEAGAHQCKRHCRAPCVCCMETPESLMDMAVPRASTNSAAVRHQCDQCRLHHSVMQVTVLAAGRGVRSVVLRLPMYAWGNGGSFFIPLNIGVAKEHGKALYILPGMQTMTQTCARLLHCLQDLRDLQHRWNSRGADTDLQA